MSRQVVASLSALALLSIAASLPPSTFEQLVRQADVIARGTVQQVLRGPAGTESLHTTIVLSVIEQWKGPPLMQITLRQPGGSQGGIAEAVPGLPTFRPGEEVILFLREDAQGSYEVVNGKQGKMQVRDQAGETVVEDVSDKLLKLSELRRMLMDSTKTSPP